MKMEEKRNITVTLAKAKEWFYSENAELKKIALQAFKEDELKHNFKNIKTFKDACKALGLNDEVMTIKSHSISSVSKASAAMFKLNIVKKALNLGYDLNLTTNSKDCFVFSPINPFVTKDSTYYANELNSDKIEVIGMIKSNGVSYLVLGNGAIISGKTGLGSFAFNVDVGFSYPNVGFLGCVTEEIARHFGKYFGMLIVEAMYGDITDFEINNDKYGNTK